MKLKSIKIENYKSFGNENNTLILENINTVIGKNESGKTNLIDCLSKIDLTGINDQLQDYVENNILPIYKKNDSGHGIEHIQYVIRRSIAFAKQFENINLDMVYVIAVFHDLAHHIDKDNHEILSAKLFYENETMKHFFTN